MTERSIPEVPDLNAQYRTERTLRDLTWGPGRTMPPAPQMTQPTYRDMSMDGARAEWDRMHDGIHLQQQASAQPDVRMPFLPPEVLAQNSPPQHRAEDDFVGLVLAALAEAGVIALAPAARRAAARYRALPVKQKALIILAVVAIIAVLLYI